MEQFDVAIAPPVRVYLLWKHRSSTSIDEVFFPFSHSFLSVDNDMQVFVMEFYEVYLYNNTYLHYE